MNYNNNNMYKIKGEYILIIFLHLKKCLTVAPQSIKVLVVPFYSISMCLQIYTGCQFDHRFDDFAQMTNRIHLCAENSRHSIKTPNTDF